MQRVSIVGLDGSGKDTSLDELVNNPPANVKVLLGSAVIGRGVAEHFELANPLKPSRSMKLLAGVSYGVATHVRYEPNQAHLIHRYNPDVVVSSREPIIDSMVYGPFYFPAVGLVPASVMVWLLHGLGHPLPSHVIFYDADPEVAMARISNVTARRAFTANPRKRQHHESFDGLRKIRQSYNEVLGLFAEMGVNVDVIDTTGLSVSQATAALYGALVPVLNSGNGGGEVRLLVTR
ncbi:hypothetical protein HYU18_01900 [Candidatus Woesearchaeota archaeon]|nr:hypothetical protein [Candidatus Woesearchaeota archaeon]